MPSKIGCPVLSRFSRLLRISSRTERPRKGASAQRLFFNSPNVRGSIMAQFASKYRDKVPLQFSSPCRILDSDIPSPQRLPCKGSDRVVHPQLPPDGATMKTILMLTAVLVLAGCGDRKGT